MSVKEEARQIIDALPDDASLDEVMHALYIAAKFKKGEAEIREGRGVRNAEAKKKLKKWLK